MIRKLILAACAAATLTLAGCGQSYTYEADPEGGNPEDPREIDCFIIEADASSDDGDIALGRFCRASQGEDD